MQTNLNLDIHSHAQLHQALCLPRVYLPCLWYAYYHLIRELIFSVSCEIDVVFRLFSLRIIIRLMQCQSISYLVHCICLKKLGLLSMIVSIAQLFIIGPQTLFLQFFSYTSVHYINEGQCCRVHIFRFIKCLGSTGKKCSAHIFRFIPIILSQFGQFMVSSVIRIYFGGFKFDFIHVQY